MCFFPHCMQTNSASRVVKISGKNVFNWRHDLTTSTALLCWAAVANHTVQDATQDPVVKIQKPTDLLFLSFSLEIKFSQQTVVMESI